MYELIDRPVCELSSGGRFVLWAMRGWAYAVERASCPALALCRGFASIGGQSALSDFHIACLLLNQHGRDRIALAPLQYPTIAEHEAILLTLWRDLALARFEQVQSALALIVDDHAAAPVRRAMSAASAKFALAGCELSILTPPEIETHHDE